MEDGPAAKEAEDEKIAEAPFVIPAEATEPCRLFLFAEAYVIQFVTDVLQIAQNRDELRMTLLQLAHDEWKKTIATPEQAEASHFELEVEQIIDRNNTAVALIERNAQLLLQVMLTRSVDNFLCYLGELLALIYRHSPKSLMSSQQTETLEFILSYSTLDDLHAAIAENHIDKVTKGGGMDKLADDFQKRLKLTLFESEDGLARATRIIALRNLFVHKRGRVDRFFLTQVKDSPWKLGEWVRLTVKEVQADQEFLARAGIAIDERAAAKFGLPTAPTAPPTQEDDSLPTSAAGAADQQEERSVAASNGR